jgi:endonuclease I
MNRKTLLFILLLGISFGLTAQIPPGYYDNAQGLNGTALKSALHNIIKGHTEYSYNDLRDFILRDTDEDPDNSNNVILLYTGRSQSKNSFGGGANDWNREHVWAKSHGDFGNSPPCGTDAHHIRPTDASVNSSRGHKDFAMGGQQHSEATGCYFTEYTWEPRDEVKGDVARMIFYMSVRYEGGGGEPDLEVVDQINTYPQPKHGKLSDLLEWNMQDPPDDFETHRNDVIYGYQNNRNPFIDHPEYVNAIWNPSSSSSSLAYSYNITIFPQPATDRISIRSDDLVKDYYDITIYNLFGQVVYTSDDTYCNGIVMTLELPELKPALYIIQINSDNQSYTSKLTVKGR